MNIGIVPRPTKARDWPQIKAFLEPAAKRGGVPILERHELVWTVEEGGELLAAATARLTDEGYGEIVLVGGKDYRRWLGPLDWRIGNAMRQAGMRSVRAYGRKGWKRELEALGWEIIGSMDGVTAYERRL